MRKRNKVEQTFARNEKNWLNKVATWHQRFSTHWYYLFVVGAIMFTLIYLFYFIFAYTTNIPDLSSVGSLPIMPNPADYPTANSYLIAQNIYFNQLRTYYNALESAYRAMPVTMNYTALVILMAIITGIALIYVVGMIINDRISWPALIGIVLLLGIMMRMGYGFYTDAIVTRQHDVWHSLGYGHYGIIISIFNTGKVPSVPLSYDATSNSLVPYIIQAYQLYHPKYSHYILAYFMRFNSLFLGDNIWTLYQANRILLIWTMVMSLFFANQIFKDFHLSEPARLLGIAIIAFSPAFYRLSAATNNDNMMVFFISLSFLLAVRFYKHPRYITAAGLALAIGLAIGSKISAGIIALPIGAMLIYLLIKRAREIKLHHPGHPFLNYLFMLILFAVIVFPIGLFWPVYNYVNYDQPFTYVFYNLNQGLLVQNNDFISRFLSFPFSQLIKSPFPQLWTSSPLGQDYNIYTTILKSSAFGEFSSNFYVAAVLLYVMTIIVFFLFVIGIIGYIIMWIIRKKAVAIVPVAIGLGIMIIFFLSYAYFNYKYPATCTMDFRYLVPLLFGLGLLFAGLSDSFIHSKNAFNSSIYLFAISIIGFYSFASLLYYIFLPII